MMTDIDPNDDYVDDVDDNDDDIEHRAAAAVSVLTIAYVSLQNVGIVSHGAKTPPAPSSTITTSSLQELQRQNQ